jgi:hypothetical protein
VTDTVRDFIIGLGTFAALVFTGWQSFMSRRKAGRAAGNTDRLANGLHDDIARSLREVKGELGKIRRDTDEHLEDHRRGRAIWLIRPRRSRRDDR